MNITLILKQYSEIFLEIFKELMGGPSHEDAPKLHIISADPNKVIEFDDNVSAWIDQDTDLMWEVKTEENLCYWYSWNEKASKNNISLRESFHDEKDIFAHADKLNREQYAGFIDWRIPTKKELATLLTEKGVSGFYTKLPLVKNSSNCYWSSCDFEGSKYSAWCIDITYKGIYDDYKGNNNYVRCVRNND